MDYVETPEERFANLKDYPFAPHYHGVDPSGMRMHYVDEGPRDAAPILMLHGEPSWSYLYRSMIPVAVAAGRRVIALEDVGDAAPWEADLTGPVLFVVGGEHSGIPPEVLARCDAVVRIPMRGFIRSYNLQAAVAIVAAERLRQQAQAGDGA